MMFFKNGEKSTILQYINIDAKRGALWNLTFYHTNTNFMAYT